MKKAISLFLALVMCLALCACGGETANTNDTNNETTINIPENQDTTSTTEPENPTADTDDANKKSPINTQEITTTIEPEGPSAESIRIGETISLDYAALTLDAFEISDGYEFEYIDKSSGISVTYLASIDCPSGMKLACLKGKFTNKSKNEVYPSNDPAYGKVIINGYEYETRMQCYNVAEADSIMGVAPLREVDYFLYAEVPETLAAEIETCEFYIGFAKDLDPSVWIRDMSDCDALYLLEEIPVAE